VPTVAVTITRTELSLATLTLTNPGTYDVRVSPVNLGQHQWRRQFVRSPYVEGATEVGRARDITYGDLVIDVQGASQAAIKTGLTALLAAFHQSSYTLTVTVDGEAYAWSCLAADVESVGIVSDDSVFGLILPVALRFPRQPVATTGPF
jgi:hypothetical protein